MAVSEKLYGYQLLEVGGESTFGTASTNLDYLETAEVIARGGLTQEALVNNKSRQRMTNYARIIGKKGGQVTVKMHGHGYSASVPSSAPSISASTGAGATAFDHWVSMLGSAFGNVMAGGYVSGTVGASGTPTDTITETDLSSFAAGQAIAWATGDSTIPYEVNWLTAIDTGATPDEGTLMQTPQFDPQGTDIFGSYTAFMKTTDAYHASGAKSFTVKLTAHDGIFTAVGCRISALSFTANVGELPYWDVTFDVANWTHDTASGLPAEGTYSFPDPEPCLLNNVSWAGDAGDPLVVVGFTFDLGLQIQPVMDMGAVSGVGGFYTVTRDPSITFRTFREDNGDLDDFQSQASQAFIATVGTRPGKLISFCFPASHVVDKPSEEDDNNAVMQSITIKPVRYTGDTGTEADSSPIDTDARVGFC